MKHILAIVCLFMLSNLFGCNKAEDVPQEQAPVVDPADPVVVSATITAVACGTETPMSCVSSVFITSGRNEGRTCTINELLGSRGDSINIKTFNYRHSGAVGCNNE